MFYQPNVSYLSMGTSSSVNTGVGGNRCSEFSSCSCSFSIFLTSVSPLTGVESQSVEICNTVDIRGETNREIAMRITSDLNNKDRFYTDLNGYQVETLYIPSLFL